MRDNRSVVEIKGFYSIQVEILCDVCDSCMQRCYNITFKLMTVDASVLSRKTTTCLKPLLPLCSHHSSCIPQQILPPGCPDKLLMHCGKHASKVAKWSSFLSWMMPSHI